MDEMTEPQQIIVEPTKRGLRERRAYIVLVCISVGLSVLVYLGSQYKQTQDEHKFCDIVNFSLAGPPPPKPADPKAHPSRQRAYEGYLKVVRLAQVLGCD